MSAGRADAVILNPRSGAGKGVERWRRVLAADEARARGLRDAPVFDGRGRGGLDALGDWVRERLAQGAVNFVAAGGDGTVNLAVGALVAAGAGGRAVLGAVALGSSNDFHKPFGPSRGAAADRVTANGVRCRLAFEAAAPADLGRVILGDAGEAAAARHFVVNASVGVTAEANALFNGPGPALSALKRRWVDGAIVAAALGTFARYRSFEAELAVGSERPRPVRLTNLGVVKNPNFSGGMRYDVAQKPDDGLFGVHLCEGLGRAGMLRTLVALGTGRFRGLPGTSSASAARVWVRAPRPFAVETDGEVTTTNRAEFVALNKKVRLCP